MRTGEYVPITFLSPGERGEIVEIRGGRGIAQRLYEMGFIPSTVLEVLVSNPRGPILVSIRGTRVAIGGGMAMKVIVRRV